mmetsp:Transcript_37618/g.106257  ORF Transcript_37618/g.106257 Transcript_37618/m.106257 type:complete len:165 (+) Transcript_37618:374-868(+)|eukprot:CAMPEP_0117649474 /NCGR_PEP_ID=MMETSP0804-20121206/992_1 /TAXON_ID=1074897 /ORGANISM="Tetraselmis astigmatica, Strain CCMP880" /LENGTH=164 /DNA_ID=CAMNT_0005455215 /DNA_START=331 /DNA_END=825 /DNA_ORIENTATION=+
MASEAGNASASPASELEALSIEGSRALHRAVNTVSAILSVSGGESCKGHYLHVELQALSLDAQYHRLCQEYLSQSKELKSIVSRCQQQGELLGQLISKEAAPGGEGTEEEAEELEGRAADLQVEVRTKNIAVKRMMDQMMMLLDDMTMWECCSRDTQTTPTSKP